jgi:small-conductance mechanosensitive channel
LPDGSCCARCATASRRPGSPTGPARWQRTPTTVIALLAPAWIWIDAFNDLGTFLGLLSAGVAIALADVLKNMAGWMYIPSRRPFRVGDRIEIEGTRGDVVDIRLFCFSLMEIGNWVDAEQSTGRLVHVPNGSVFINQVANYTEGFQYILARDARPHLLPGTDHHRAPPD